MATSISAYAASGYPTDKTMRISVSFSVTYAGRYCTEFELRRGGRYGSLEDTAIGSTFSLSAGGSKSGLQKTFNGLDPLTDYTIIAYLCNADTGSRLNISPAYVSFTTEASPAVGENYFAKVVLNGNGGSYNGNTTWTFENWALSWDGYADIQIYYSDPGFVRPGYRLAGWSEYRNSSKPSYSANGSISIYTTSTDSRYPKTITLYAVWSSSRPENWYWRDTVSKGSTLGLTASEWNDFISRIQEFATYRGIGLSSSNLSAGYATKGYQMMASQARAVRSLIAQLNPPVSIPSDVSPGSSITAAFINGLKDSLNSIP